MTEEEEIAELLELKRQANQEGLNYIKKHLTEYVESNKKDSTFKGWISHLHPENVNIDPRITIKDSDYLKIWNSSRLRNKYNLQIKHHEEPVKLVDSVNDLSLSRTQAFSRGRGKTIKEKKKKKKQKSKSHKRKKQIKK